MSDIADAKPEIALISLVESMCSAYRCEKRLLSNKLFALGQKPLNRLTNFTRSKDTVKVAADWLVSILSFALRRSNNEQVYRSLELEALVCGFVRLEGPQTELAGHI